MKTRNHCYSNIVALEQFIEQQSYKSNNNLLIQIFTADTENKYLGTIIDCLKTKLPKAIVIGASTDGEICDGKASTNSTVLSFTQFNATKLKAQIYTLDNNQFKLGQKIATDLCSADTQTIIILADGLHTNGDDLLDGFFDVNKKVVIAGGLAGDYRLMQKTLVICQGDVKEKSVVACALNNKDLLVNTQNVFGWHQIGKRMLVTKAIGNRLYELDGIPLRDVYAKYFGEGIASELPASAGEYPLIISRFGKNIARAALNLFPDGSMLYAGNFKFGDKLQFGYGHIPIILSSAQETIERLNNIPIESTFIYSCSARKYFMGDEVNKEILPLELLASTSGFFTYGEFFHGGSKNELLNESMTLLMLSEENKSSNIDLKSRIEADQKESHHVYDKLFHLIDATGNELTETNEKLEFLVEEKTKELIERIYLDPLSSLPNRNRLLDDFNAKSDFRPHMMALINIDEFKQVNDYYGYKVGDQLLLKIAQELQKIVAKNNNASNLKIYKLPIDEFAIAASSLVPTIDFVHLIDNEVGAVFANQLLIGSDRFYPNQTVGLSLGRAESNDFLHDPDGLLLQANMALRAAKDNKLKRVVYRSDMELKQMLEHNILWTNKIKLAIKEGRFVPYFQPIFSSSTGKIEKYECLIRMIDVDGKEISPYMFLDIAKKSKLYPDLTRIMIDKCFAKFAKNKLHFSLNLSAIDILNQLMVAYLVVKIKEYAIGDRLTLELLESEGIADYSVINAFIDNIRQYGCKVAIDDFGSGYSNFNHLVKMKIDYLKIDGSLIKNINNDNEVKIMVEMILDFCKKINIKTVAEFVSDKLIFDTIKEMGVDYLQGFYLGEPKATFDDA
jgi:diguanylate cyclase (GGDEF)-like protein